MRNPTKRHLDLVVVTGAHSPVLKFQGHGLWINRLFKRERTSFNLQRNYVQTFLWLCQQAMSFLASLFWNSSLPLAFYHLIVSIPLSLFTCTLWLSHCRMFPKPQVGYSPLYMFPLEEPSPSSNHALHFLGLAISLS